MLILAALLVPVAFTVPDAVCACTPYHATAPVSYEARMWDERGVAASVTLWGDSLGRAAAVPVAAGGTQRAWVLYDSGQPITRNLSLRSIDDHGNASAWSNVLALKFVGAVAAESCCSYVPAPIARPQADGGPAIPMALTLGGGLVSWVRAQSDSGPARIETIEDEVQRDRAWICGHFGFYALRGSRQVCP